VAERSGTTPQVRGPANWGFPSVQPQPPGAGEARCSDGDRYSDHETARTKPIDFVHNFLHNSGLCNSCGNSGMEIEPNWGWIVGAVDRRVPLAERSETTPQVRGPGNWGFPSVQPHPPGVCEERCSEMDGHSEHENGENEANRFRAITINRIVGCVIAVGNWAWKSNPIETGSSGRPGGGIVTIRSSLRLTCAHPSGQGILSPGRSILGDRVDGNA
jgi:hypothetical protein